MPSTRPKTTVITHAVVGPRDHVFAWFAANGLVPDAFLVAERPLHVEGATYIDRYVAHSHLGAAEAARYDHVTDASRSLPADP